MIKEYKVYILLSFYFLLIGNCIDTYAQTKLQVITKTIEKSVPFGPTDVIKIEGEKATIVINTWSKNEVKVTLKQISKSPSKEIAENELKFQRYIIEKLKNKNKSRNKNTIHIKNYFAIPKGTKKLNSLQLSKFEIWIPKYSNTEIINNYGNVTLTDKSGFTDINVKYGNINLKNISGELILKNYFGDLTGKNIDGKFTGIFNHTKISLESVSGEWELNSTLGDVVIDKMDDLKSMKITASKADITIEVQDFEKFQYSLETSYGDILVPTQYENHFEQFDESKKKFSRDLASYSPIISVKTSFGKIIIQ